MRRAVGAAAALGIEWLTLFAFSSDNWQRPPREVATLLDLFGDFLRTEHEAWARRGIRLGVIGRRDRFGDALAGEVERAERATRSGDALRLRLAIDYSGREAILGAVRRSTHPARSVSREEFARLLASASVPSPGAEEDVEREAIGEKTPPDVDLLIRTGGSRG